MQKFHQYGDPSVFKQKNTEENRKVPLHVVKRSEESTRHKTHHITTITGKTRTAKTMFKTKTKKKPHTYSSMFKGKNLKMLFVYSSTAPFSTAQVQKLSLADARNTPLKDETIDRKRSISDIS